MWTLRSYAPRGAKYLEMKRIVRCISSEMKVLELPGWVPAEASQFLDLLMRTSNYDLKRRITADDILKHLWIAGVKR